MTKMRIGINVSPLQSGHQTRGIGFYTKNLIEALSQNPAVEVVELMDQASRSNVDLIHYPYFDLFEKSLKMVGNTPVVVTVHDVTPLVFPQAYPPGIKGRWRLRSQRHTLQKAAAVITDSLASKQDIQRLLNYPANQIWPIYLAPGSQFKAISQDKLQEVQKKYHLPEKFAVYTGNVNWNKNLIQMAAACLKLDLDLVMVGSGFENRQPNNHSEQREYRQFLAQFQDQPKIHLIGFVPDEDLVGILNSASVALFATRYEGFGLPILEAQASGVPVVTSQVSSMPEVAGKGAILVDPNSVESIAAGLNRVMSDPAVSRQLVKLGRENVAKFSWAKTAALTIEVYQTVLKDRG